MVKLTHPTTELPRQLSMYLIYKYLRFLVLLSSGNNYPYLSNLFHTVPANSTMRHYNFTTPIFSIQIILLYHPY